MKKCHLCQRSLSFLGHVIAGIGICTQGATKVYWSCWIMTVIYSTFLRVSYPTAHTKKRRVPCGSGQQTVKQPLKVWGSTDKITHVATYLLKCKLMRVKSDLGTVLTQESQGKKHVNSLCFMHSARPWSKLFSEKEHQQWCGQLKSSNNIWMGDILLWSPTMLL